MSRLDQDELQDRLIQIFEPEPDEDGLVDRAPPHPRLTDFHHLDVSYWEPYEFGSMSPYSRLVEDPTDPINKTTQSLSAPFDLFLAGLRLFGDSILAYCEVKSSRRGPLRFYPPILMTFWAGFEAFVRLYAEILFHMVPNVPPATRLALLEVEEYVERNGTIRQRQRSRPVLDRYWLLLKHGYGLKFDRGSNIWQSGEAAMRKRNEFVHYKVGSAPSIMTSELWTYLEAVMLLLIGPSAILKRSVFSHQFDVYWALVELKPLINEFEEKPIHKGWPFSPYQFPCSFKGIDDTRYPPGSRPTRLKDVKT